MRRTQSLLYWHAIPVDFVPAGQTASRFQSTATPSARSSAVREYLLAPVFGRPAPRLATLALPAISKRDWFLSGQRAGLLDAVRERCVPAQVAADSGAELALGVLLDSHCCPWAPRGIDRGNRNLKRVLSQFNVQPQQIGIEVTVLFKRSPKEDDSDAAEEAESKKLEAAFEALQRELVDAVVRRRELAHLGIIGLVPWAATPAPEAVLDSFEGNEISLEQVEATLRRWKEREAIASSSPQLR